MSASAMLLSVRGGLCGPSCVRYIRAVEGGERMSAVRGGGEGGELRGYVEAPVSLHLSHIHTHTHTHTHTMIIHLISCQGCFLSLDITELP